MNPPVAEAVEGLRQLDPIMAAHIDRIGPCTIGSTRPRESAFEQLAREIAFQQLAGAAARTIWGRVRALVIGPFTAEAVLSLSMEQLRGAGLSNNKALSVLDLAAHVADGRVNLRQVSRLDDEAVIEELIKVRGIGRWTAEMFLMFRLLRLDVWPVGDLGVRNGYSCIYSLAEPPSVKEFLACGDKFRPYRSVAAWYCWRAVDVKPAAT